LYALHTEYSPAYTSVNVTVIRSRSHDLFASSHADRKLCTRTRCLQAAERGARCALNVFLRRIQFLCSTLGGHFGARTGFIRTRLQQVTEMVRCPR